MAPPSSLTLMQDEEGGGGEVVVSTPRKEEVLERATREEVQAESSLQPVLRASMKRWRSHQGAFNNEERIRTGGEEQHHQHEEGMRVVSTADLSSNEWPSPSEVAPGQA